MRVIAGERSVTIGLSYEQAADLIIHIPVQSELYGQLVSALDHGKKHGFPLPPLSKTNVAHDSDVDIVDG